MAKAVTSKAGDNAAQALSPFTYDEDTGLLVRGQVFILKGHRNDHLLLGMDYVRPVEKDTPVVQCAECGAIFLDEAARERHGQHFHDHWCDCGWVPSALDYDKDQAMRVHTRQCPVWASEREAAHKRHVAIAKEKQQQAALASA